MINVFTDYDFYIGTYKDDMGEITIPQESFKKWAIKSSNLIRQYTFNNINESAPILDKVQYCCCELAEHLYQCDKRDTEGDNSGIASEKDGSWSVTYESREKVSENDMYASKGIIYNWLSDTGLLYCGV
ncbi:MAG: hypothetical protein ACK5JH_15230 [Anaerocolumna sp.]